MHPLEKNDGIQAFARLHRHDAPRHPSQQDGEIQEMLANLQLAMGRLSISLRPLLPGKNRKESLTQSTEKLSLCDQALVFTDDAFVEQYILK